MCSREYRKRALTARFLAYFDYFGRRQKPIRRALVGFFTMKIRVFNSTTKTNFGSKAPRHRALDSPSHIAVSFGGNETQEGRSSRFCGSTDCKKNVLKCFSPTKRTLVTGLAYRPSAFSIFSWFARKERSRVDRGGEK